MCGTIERIVREHAEGEGAADAGVMDGKVAHSVAKRRERCRHVLVMHAMGELVRGTGRCGCAEHVEEEGVRTLVAEQEREKFLLPGNDVFREERG